MNSLARLLVATLAGAVIAWITTLLFVYALEHLGGYEFGAVQLQLGAFGLIGAGGGLVGMGIALVGGRRALPDWVKPIVIGSLTGVAVVAVGTLMLDSGLGGPSSKGQAPYLHAGLIYGVPIGLAAGALGGWMHIRRMGRRISLAKAPE